MSYIIWVIWDIMSHPKFIMELWYIMRYSHMEYKGLPSYPKISRNKYTYPIQWYCLLNTYSYWVSDFNPHLTRWYISTYKYITPKITRNWESCNSQHIGFQWLHHGVDSTPPWNTIKGATRMACSNRHGEEIWKQRSWGEVAPKNMVVL